MRMVPLSVRNDIEAGTFAGRIVNSAVTFSSSEQRELRTALGHYATGVAVVTTQTADGRPAGMTINSFSSLSLDPPLVLWCLQLSSDRFTTFAAAGYFAINVLAASQEQVARRFAARSAARFRA